MQIECGICTEDTPDIIENRPTIELTEIHIPLTRDLQLDAVTSFGSSHWCNYSSTVVQPWFIYVFGPIYKFTCMVCNISLAFRLS